MFFDPRDPEDVIINFYQCSDRDDCQGTCRSYMFLTNVSVNQFLIPSEDILVPFHTTVVFVTDITITEYAKKIVVPPSLFRSQSSGEFRQRRDPEATLKLSQATRPPKIFSGSVANETWRHCGMQFRQVHRLSASDKRL
jgi:hypothetical protein